VLKSVICPFKETASYETINSGCGGDLLGNLVNMRKLITRRENYPLTSYILSLDPVTHECSTEGLAELFHGVVQVLSALDADRNKLYENIESRSWRLHLLGTDFFCVVMSNIYTHSHPRYIDNQTLIVFQPEEQFSVLGITSSNIRLTYTARAQKAFENAGRRYFSHHQMAVPKARRFVLNESGLGLEWWKTNPLKYTCEEARP
jgi:hypothetical protein